MRKFYHVHNEMKKLSRVAVNFVQAIYREEERPRCERCRYHRCEGLAQLQPRKWLSTSTESKELLPALMENMDHSLLITLERGVEQGS
jgi:hypothetical protein